jgi:twin BRCT domain
MAGGAYDEYLKPTTSVLVCRSPSANVQKLQFAAEHGIPAVSLGWVMDSIQHGEVQPFESYVLQPILRNSRDKDR